MGEALAVGAVAALLVQSHHLDFGNEPTLIQVIS